MSKKRRAVAVRVHVFRKKSDPSPSLAVWLMTGETGGEKKTAATVNAKHIPLASIAIKLV